jgi:putative ubiquitin-RnfH superfamily antitoxin RatB of RatAB toxin-antitoxin module
VAEGAVLKIEVAYATPDRQWLVPLEVARGATVQAAVTAALANEVASDVLDQLPVGIWGRVTDREHCLADGDRVEVYRPLLRDPRDARRDLAAAGRLMSG